MTENYAMLKNLFVLFFLLFYNVIHATIIQGVIKNDEGQLLPFASITIKGSQQGITANNKGWYQMDLNPGKYILEIQHVGYQKVEKEIIVEHKNLKIDFILSKQIYVMDEIIVKSKGEDPAYKIIRNAIKKRAFHDAQIDSFSVDVYIKGLMQTKKMPKKVLGQKIETSPEDGLDSAGRGVVFLSESHTKVDMVYPDKIKLEVYSTRESGGGMGFSFPTFISFYKNNVTVFADMLNPRGFVSPIADNALNFYKYKLIGTYTVDGKLIKTILVTPKRKNEPTFSGKIEIINDEWKIYSVDFLLTKQNQLELVEKLQIVQIHEAITPLIWRIKNQIIKVDVNQLGFELDGAFVNVYEHYNLHPHFDNKHFDKVIIKYDTGYNKKDSNYWNVKRPIALEDFEVKDFIKKDSLRVRYDSIRQTKSYRDSVNKKRNSVSFSQLALTGYSKNILYKKGSIRYQISGLLDAVSFNTVEGMTFNFKPQADIQFKNYPLKYSLSSNIRYGFKNRHFNMDGRLDISSKKNFSLNNRILSISGGSRVQQLNKENPISPLLNSVYTLFFRENFMKIYENQYAQLYYQTKLASGLQLKTSLVFENRLPLKNTIDYSFTHQNKAFMPNHPLPLYHKPFYNHQAFIFDMSIQYQPKQRIIEFPDRKISAGSKKPIYTLYYAKGINGVLGSDVDYDKWEATMSHAKNFKLAGTLKYKLGMGGFINSKYVGIPDMKHFNGNQTFWIVNYLNSFQIAPYYQYSNEDKLYLFGHIDHHLNGLLSNKIPVINQLKWNLVAGANGFYINRNKYYSELFIGFENIFKILRVDFISSYQPIYKNSLGVRVGLGGVLGSNIRFQRR